jgi:hypothetical protein
MVMVTDGAVKEIHGIILILGLRYSSQRAMHHVTASTSVMAPTPSEDIR